MSKPIAAVSWSGGKDSCLALHRARQDYDIRALVTMLTEDGVRSRSHGLRPEVLERQAAALGFELVCGRASWESYEAEFARLLHDLRLRGFTHVVFGDILFQHHRGWTQRLCAQAGLEAVEPLFEECTGRVVQEFLDLRGEALIVTVRDACLDETWLGRKLNSELIQEFKRRNVDPSGENGEYHTLVAYFPGFSVPLRLKELGKHRHNGCTMLDLAAELQAPSVR
ncbi:MAG: diphthine--ammonia ligase [Terriglobales bacterium]